jgi:hypothetical protein
MTAYVTRPQGSLLSVGASKACHLQVKTERHRTVRAANKTGMSVSSSSSGVVNSLNIERFWGKLTNNSNILSRVYGSVTNNNGFWIG